MRLFAKNLSHSLGRTKHLRVTWPVIAHLRLKIWLNQKLTSSLSLLAPLRYVVLNGLLRNRVLCNLCDALISLLDNILKVRQIWCSALAGQHLLRKRREQACNLLLRSQVYEACLPSMPFIMLRLKVSLVETHISFCLQSIFIFLELLLREANLVLGLLLKSLIHQGIVLV